jgi:hypothetical protein
MPTPRPGPTAWRSTSRRVAHEAWSRTCGMEIRLPEGISGIPYMTSGVEIDLPRRVGGRITFLTCGDAEVRDVPEGPPDP